MSVEMVMFDNEDPGSALDILLRSAVIMPEGFFSRLAIVGPHRGFPYPPNVDHIHCPTPMPFYAFNIWLVREFPRFMVCDHMLSIHRDGYILNPEKWNPRWLDYDWVGAPWGVEHVGGNGGFCLISKRFAKWYSLHPYPLVDNGGDASAHDLYVCKTLGGSAQAAGFKFAPVSVACDFSVEKVIPQFPRTLDDVFGFHGKWHIPNIVWY